MKKTFYFLMMFVGLAITGCEPMEDIHDEIDAELEGKVAGAVDYTLEEDDYTETLELGFPNFGSEEEAKELIPVVLNEKFPALGANSSVNVTFDLYDPIRVQEATVASADYEGIGLSVDYFSDFSEIQEVLAYKYPQAEQGDYVELTYRTLADEIMYNLTPEDFDLIEEEFASVYPDAAESAGNYSNFERREDNDAYWSDAMILEALNVVLSENYDDVEGQKYNVSYRIYNGNSGTESMTVQFDGNAYVAVGGTAYEFANADYEFVASEFASTYPGPAENVGNYGSFDVRSSSDNYWSDDMLMEAINAVLMEQYPSAETGAKFEVSFKVYPGGGTTTWIWNVILTDDGYIIDESASVSTIEETKVFAYANGDWNEPFMLPADSYTEEFGQTYSNFDDEDEALYKIGIYLESVYPYAEEGDFVPVGYKFYDDGSTDIEYANFVFENGEWNFIPSVVQTSLQFGNDGSAWIPDNTIRYTLAGSDYAIIASEFGEVYPGPAGSVDQYSNFDRREGNSAYWSDDMILEAMQVLLDEIAPNAEVGQKYVITYAIYNGTNTTEEISLIKNEDGEWVINE